MPFVTQRDISNKTRSRLVIPDLAVMSVIYVTVPFVSVNVCFTFLAMNLSTDVYERSIYRINTFLKSAVSLIH